MQRASERVGALAAALAKAQSELANPEKSLTATIVSPFPREGSRTFRYAPLASGLDLVRKCLGRHEIATVQATAMDRVGGLICLTTTLVHASGEWVSSEWPVCPLSETIAPHRLGTALTYARRYALFTLVGIAGEDDLDAPDQALPRLPASQNGPQGRANDSALQAGLGASGALQAPPSRPGTKRPDLPRLTPQASGELAQRLLSELVVIETPEALAVWARAALPRKQGLHAAEVQSVEVAFLDALARVGELPGDDQTIGSSDPHGPEWSPPAPQTGSVVPIAKPVRERDRHHLRFVAMQPCLACGRTPSDAHHVKFAELTAMGRKVSDKFTVPLCRLHHRDLHRRGDERIWWTGKRIDPLAVAATLWSETHANGAAQPSSVTQTDEPKGLSGFRATGTTTTAVNNQNDETKPFLQPVAE